LVFLVTVSVKVARDVNAPADDTGIPLVAVAVVVVARVELVVTVVTVVVFCADKPKENVADDELEPVTVPVVPRCSTVDPDDTTLVILSISVDSVPVLLADVCHSVAVVNAPTTVPETDVVQSEPRMELVWL
jgi:hypothetical protein